MNVLTAFKVCPDYDKLKNEDISIKGLSLETYFLPLILNCYDESSLELALRLRDSSDSDIRLSAISAGDDRVEIYLSTLRALGYDETVHIRTAYSDVVTSPEQIAATVAYFALETNQQLIIVGRQAPSGNYGAFASLLSLFTGYHVIAPVIDIISADEASVTVLIDCDGEIVKQEAALPCVLSVGNAVISKLRVPTLRYRIATKTTESREYNLLSVDAVSIPEPKCIEKYDNTRQAYISSLSGKDAVEDIMQLFDERPVLR